MGSHPISMIALYMNFNFGHSLMRSKQELHQSCVATTGSISLTRRKFKTLELVSDWFATHSGVKSINAGLDVKMPGPINQCSIWIGDAYFGQHIV